jgi:hypothetical protein
MMLYTPPPPARNSIAALLDPDAARTIIIDAAHPHWQGDVEEAVLAGHEVELIHYTPGHEDECVRLSNWLRMELLINEASQIAMFRRASATRES